MTRKTIFPYPAVQYIPLRLEIVYKKQPVQTRPFLLIGAEIEARRLQMNKKFNLDLPYITDSGHKLYLLAGGLDLSTARYRGYYVTIKGAKDESISLYRLPAGYFYKETLVFEVKESPGTPLLSKTYHLGASFSLGS